MAAEGKSLEIVQQMTAPPQSRFGGAGDFQLNFTSSKDLPNMQQHDNT